MRPPPPDVLSSSSIAARSAPPGVERLASYRPSSQVAVLYYCHPLVTAARQVSLTQFAFPSFAPTK